jgi:heme a synthase
VSTRRWADHAPTADETEADRRIGRVAIGVAVLVYAQILLGAVVRHTGSGLAFADFPLSGGRIVPAFPHPSMAIQFAHRVGAILVLLAFAGLLWTTLRERGASRRVRRLSIHAAGVALIQIALGAASVWTRLTPGVTILHVVCGALLLASTLSLALWCHHAALAAAPEWADDRALRVASR